MTSNMNSSAVRHPNEDLLREGPINVSQINHILRNPELPKSRLQMKNILRKYNEEKRRALTLSRIQCTANSTLLTTNCGNSSDKNNSNPVTNPSTNRLSPDLEQMSHFEVKFSQLPQEILITILGETFTKYENEMNRRSEDHGSQAVPQTSVSVKTEALPDNEDECLIIEDKEESKTVDSLKRKIKDLTNEYKCVEKEEMIVSSDLRAVSEELEDKLTALREYIEFCETLKQKNISINEKYDNLKDRKIQLTNQIKEIEEKLTELSGVSADDQRTVPIKAEAFEIIDLSDDLEASNLNSPDKNRNKSTKEINFTKNKRKEKSSSTVETTESPKKLKNNCIKGNKSEKSSNNRNKDFMKSIEYSFSSVELIGDEHRRHNNRSLNKSSASLRQNAKPFNTKIPKKFAADSTSGRMCPASTSATTREGPVATSTRFQQLRAELNSVMDTTPDSTASYVINSDTKNSHKRHSPKNRKK